MISELLARLKSLHGSLRRGDAVNVNDESTKHEAAAVAASYFSEVRPQLVSHLGENEQVLKHDQVWQQLLRLAQRNNARRTYLKTLATLRRDLADFNVQMLASATRGTTPATSTEEDLLLRTLDGLVPSAAVSYRQGLLDLRTADRLSYRGTATEFREALREVLDHLAPDVDVTKQPGFKLETDQTKPTMKQKVRFVLTSRGRNRSQRDATERGASLIEELSGEVARAVYNRASLATHVQQAKQEVGKIKRYVDTVLFDLLEISS